MVVVDSLMNLKASHGLKIRKQKNNEKEDKTWWEKKKMKKKHVDQSDKKK